ncbi:MAG: hydroxyglutarate oxidase [Cyclobacteriaceae bacterium]|nr:MAG: hydroxyglutarate oxidase [Cyclobacteriaceae bacterium]
MKYQIIIVGGGIVGLATAYRLLQQTPDISLLLLEKEQGVGQHQTGHNSGVIHSGLYYKPGSLKARNCIQGYQQLLDFCQQYQINYEICGKIVVATEKSQLPLLNNLFERGQQNGLTGLELIPKERLHEHEPHVSGLMGIWVPQTGIIDYGQVAKTLARLITERGGTIQLGAKVTDISTSGAQTITVTTTNTTETSGPNSITTSHSNSHSHFHTQFVVNCAGLYSDQVTRLTEPDLDLQIIPFRGEYFQLKPEKEYLVKNLIYPVPDPNFPFLGVHFTRMIKGGVEAGPNAVLAMAREGYKKTDIKYSELMETLRWPGFRKIAFKYLSKGLGEMYRSWSKSAFTSELQKLIPEIEEKDLNDGGAGVRAQASNREGALLDDFYIIENQSGIHVCNAPSPAATSSLSIGETISKRVLKRIR